MAVQDKVSGLMTVEQVAAYLQLSKLTVYKYIRSGALPAVRLGKSFRVKRADVEAFLDANKVAAPRRRIAGRPRVAARPAAAAAARAEPASVSVPLTENREAPATRQGEKRRREAMIASNPLEWVIRGLH